MKPNKEEQIENLWQKAEIAYEKENYQLVIDLCGKILELNLNNDKAYYNRGNAYHDLKKYQKAIDDYDKAIQINPNDDFAYFNRGNAYSDLKQYHKAIDDYSNAIQTNPNNDKAYFNRGTTYKDLKQYHKAQSDWVRVVYLSAQKAIFNTATLAATRNLSLLHREILAIPPFLRQYVLSQLPPSIYHQFSQMLYETAKESAVFNHYIHYLHYQFQYQKITAQEYYTSLVLIYFYMGDAITCYQIIKEHLLSGKNLNINKEGKHTGIAEKGDHVGIAPTFAYYYLLLSCEAFLEPYEEYLERALVLAETQLPPKKGFFTFFNKQEKLSASEIKSTYYAGRIFLFAQQFKQARQCFKRIEKDFLPAAYELLWLCEENHSKKHDNRRELMNDSKAHKQAIALLKREKTLQATKTPNLCFSQSIPTYQLELDALKNLSVFQNAAYYLESYPAIAILFTHYSKERKVQKIYFSKPTEMNDFYTLFDLAPMGKAQILALPQKLALTQIGQAILAKTLSKQNQITLATKAQTQLATQLSIEEVQAVRALFQELQSLPNTQVEAFLAQRIYTTEIPTEKLRLLVLYTYNAQQIDVATYFMLQVYIGLCKEKFPQSVDMFMKKFIEIGFRDVFLYSAGATTALTFMYPFLTPLAAASVTCLVPVVYPIIKNEFSNRSRIPYAEFKEDFLYHLGQEQEKYGSAFDLKFNIQEFEAWARRDLNT